MLEVGSANGSNVVESLSLRDQQYLVVTPLVVYCALVFDKRENFEICNFITNLLLIPVH